MEALLVSHSWARVCTSWQITLKIELANLPNEGSDQLEGASAAELTPLAH